MARSVNDPGLSWFDYVMHVTNSTWRWINRKKNQKSCMALRSANSALSVSCSVLTLFSKILQFTVANPESVKVKNKEIESSIAYVFPNKHSLCPRSLQLQIPSMQWRNERGTRKLHAQTMRHPNHWVHIDLFTANRDRHIHCEIFDCSLLQITFPMHHILKGSHHRTGTHVLVISPIFSLQEK